MCATCSSSTSQPITVSRYAGSPPPQPWLWTHLLPLPLLLLLLRVWARMEEVRARHRPTLVEVLLHTPTLAAIPKTVINKNHLTPLPIPED